MRIVHISDTHNFIHTSDSVQLPSGDILVHTGDFSVHGLDKEFQQFDKWLQSISDLFPIRIVVFGNHDVRHYRDDWNSMKALLPSATHVLCFESVQINGYKFYGSPWLWWQNSKYELKPNISTSHVEHMFDQIPNDTDVLLTHGPAAGLHDYYEHKFHSGSIHLAREMIRVNPVLHLHGHIHESYGCTVMSCRPRLLPVPLHSICSSDDETIESRRQLGDTCEGTEALMSLSSEDVELSNDDAARHAGTGTSTSSRRKPHCVCITMNSSSCDMRTTAMINKPQVVEISLGSDIDATVVQW